MGYQPTVFNQLFNFIPRHVFEKSAQAHQADRYAKTFKAWQQFLLLLYAQATGKQSLRDIVGGLQLHNSKLYHLGLRPVPRSTIADGLERRDSKVFEEMFNAMVRKTGTVVPGHRSATGSCDTLYSSPAPILRAVFQALDLMALT